MLPTLHLTMPFHDYGEVNTHQLHFQLRGKGDFRLILIHSSMSSLRQWYAQESLAENAVLALVDLPGHGKSDPLPDPVTISSLAEVVSHFVKKLELSPAVLVGHSIGGAVAIQLALDFPSKVQALILIGTGAKLGVYPAILEGLLIDYNRAINLTIGQMAFAKNAKSQLVERAKHEALACPPDVSLADFRACNAFDVRDRLHEITVPTLILVGEEDRLTPPKWSYYLHEHIHNSQLQVIPGGGHFIIQERPDAVNQAILTFLAEHNWD